MYFNGVNIYNPDLVSVPVSHKPKVTVGAFAVNAIAEVPVFARRANVVAVLTKESGGTQLVTPGAVPASLAGDTAPFCHLAGLLPFTVATPATSTVTTQDILKCFVSHRECS